MQILIIINGLIKKKLYYWAEFRVFTIANLFLIILTDKNMI